MPVQDINKGDLKNILVAKPDLRFAASFLSNKYRVFSVKGEALMDKMTGELFIRRPEDGKVVSFFQQKRYMDDLMVELRININSNSRFTYPDETHADAYYTNTDYDLMTINDDAVVDILHNQIDMPYDSEVNFHNLEFNVSTLCNGFMCRVSSRDVDKPIITYLSNEYNSIIRNYIGTDQDFLDEQEKFKSIEKWASTNVVIKYEVKVQTKDETKEFSLTDYVNANETSCVYYSDEVYAYICSKENCTVTVHIYSIDVPKIHFLEAHINDFSFINGFSPIDNQIVMQYVTIATFIDDSENFIFNNNESVIAMISVPDTLKYVAKIAKIAENTNVVTLSPLKPSVEVWKSGGVWAEDISTMSAGGKIVETDHVTDISELERYLAGTMRTYADISRTDESDKLFLDAQDKVYYLKNAYVPVSDDVVVTGDKGDQVLILNTTDFVIFDRKGDYTTYDLITVEDE